MLAPPIHNDAEPFALKDLVCKQFLRNEFTTMKDVRHGCSMVRYNANGGAFMASQRPPVGNHYYYSVALYHVDGRALTQAENDYVRDKLDEVLTNHGVKHSVACMDSDFDRLVAQHRRISAGESNSMEGDDEHLQVLAERYAARRDSGLSHVSFAVAADEANIERLLEAMSEINTIVPERELHKQTGRC